MNRFSSITSLFSFDFHSISSPIPLCSTPFDSILPCSTRSTSIRFHSIPVDRRLAPRIATCWSFQNFRKNQLKKSNITKSEDRDLLLLFLIKADSLLNFYSKIQKKEDIARDGLLVKSFWAKKKFKNRL